MSEPTRLRFGLVVLVSILVVIANAPAPARAEHPSARTVLRPADFEGVRLDEGRLRTQLDEVRAYYLRIPNDDLLKGFRERAGLPAPGSDLGGWYTADIWNLFGQALSGLSRLHAATGDAACREKACALVDGWAACIAPDGYFYYSDHPNAHHYTYDKIVGGLVDVYAYCAYAPALAHLSRITDWAEKNLDRSRPVRAGFTYDATEWYTIGENLYRAYLLTGEERYRDFARVWDYDAYWDCYASGRSIFGQRSDGSQASGYHAYSHVNTLGGLGAGYLATGERARVRALESAYDFLQETQILPTGGYGPDESFTAAAERRERIFNSHNSAETQCGAWAALKMCRYLITCTGEARFGDWVERLVYNGPGAGIPMSPEGRAFYYADLNPGGGVKGHTSDPWSCCAGTHPSVVADYANQVYYLGRDAICVNLFTSSTLRTQIHGARVECVQRTRFPEADSTEFRIEPERPLTFELRLREPAWLAGPMRVAVNGAPFSRVRHARGWLVVRREWAPGDRVAVSLPMSFRLEPMDASQPWPAMLMRGPVLLAARAHDARALSALDPERLEEQLIPSPGEPLTYHLAGDDSVLFRPFWAYEEGEPYFPWVGPGLPIHVRGDALVLEGEWPVNTGSLYGSPVAGSLVRFEFDGTGIVWRGMRFDDAGIAEVRIDGEVVAEVDQYGPRRGEPWSWASHGLPPGRHAVELRVTGRKTEASSGTYTNFTRFEIAP